MMLQSEKGLTLAEMLAALAVLSIIIAAVTYFTVFASQSIDQIQTKDDAMRQSRDIVNHMVKAIRYSTATASADDPACMLQIAYTQWDDEIKNYQPSGDYVCYVFDSSSRTLEAITKKDSATVSTTLSKFVHDASVTLSEDDRKVEITLVMQLPNEQTYTRQATVYFPRLKTA